MHALRLVCTLAASMVIAAGARVLEGSLLAVQQAIALPKGRAAASAYLATFIGDIKTSGLVQKSIDTAALRGVNVAR